MVQDTKIGAGVPVEDNLASLTGAPVMVPVAPLPGIRQDKGKHFSPRHSTYHLTLPLRLPWLLLKVYQAHHPDMTHILNTHEMFVHIRAADVSKFAPF